MNKKIIQYKIEELRILLEQELPNTAVCIEVTYTDTGKRIVQTDSDNQPPCLGAVSCSSLQSLHQDLKGFQNMGFLTHDATMGLGIAIEQVERYMRGDLEARQ